MKQAEHISEQELVAYAFGDSQQELVVERHVSACSRCRMELAKLRSVLMAVNDETLPVPQRENYAQQVWASVKPRLTDSRQASGWMNWMRPQRLALAGGLLTLIIVAFVAGRVSRPPTEPPAQESASVDVNSKNRLVRSEVGSHLERSQMMLVELANAEAGTNGADISAEQDRARDLLDANRLYRQSAKRAGDPAVSAVLDELERVLVEIANSPSELSKQRLSELQEQIQNQGILFKVRVIGSKVRNLKEHEATQPRNPALRRS